jgi:microcystin-dependent protein
MGLISPNLPVSGVDTDAVAEAKVSSALAEIVSVINGAIDSANLADGAVTSAKLAASLQAAFIPTGVVMPTAGTAADTGFLLCDGSAVSRTTYSTLFGKIGTRWGVGDGVTTFNLPNLNSTNRVLVGSDNSDPAATTPTGYAVGATGGEKTHVLTVPELPPHTHTSNTDPFALAAGAVGGAMVGDIAGQSSTGTFASNSTGDGVAHNNMPPYAAVLYMVKT